jgi:predicted peptidase
MPNPLVLALHWGGPLYPYIGGDLLTGLVEPALRELGAIIVAPDRTTESWTDPQSEATLLALLDEIQANYAIDPVRTLITGYSIGGMGTWYMAARNPERFAAAIPIAAPPPPDAADNEWKIPLYVIHGRQDELFPLAETERVVRQLEAQGAAVELAIVDRATHYQTDRFREPLQRAIPWIRRAWEGR